MPKHRRIVQEGGKVRFSAQNSLEMGESKENGVRGSSWVQIYLWIWSAGGKKSTETKVAILYASVLPWERCPHKDYNEAREKERMIMDSLPASAPKNTSVFKYGALHRFE